jgi:hypothetical protein
MPSPCLVTGGMSWGDLPTELAEHFSVILDCDPVIAQLEAWALEDSLTLTNAGPDKLVV